MTFECTCNVDTHYPCDVENDEECRLLVDGTYACAAKCPDPGAVACPVLVRKVDCGGCVYLNQCVATSAKPEFTSKTYALVDDCPNPGGTRACPSVSAPVACAGCEYLNQMYCNFSGP